MTNRCPPRGENNAAPPQPNYALLALSILGLLIVVRLTLASPVPFTAPTTTPALATAPQTPRQQALVPTATLQVTEAPSPTSTRTTIPTRTPMPLTIAVQIEVHERYRSFFEGLAQRFEGIAIRSLAGDALSAETLDNWDAAVQYATTPPREGVLLRSEPYAAIVHPRAARADITINTLVAIVRGQDRSMDLIGVEEGTTLVPPLLGVPTWPKDIATVDTWAKATRYVATHESAIAIVPWEAVDFSVRVLTIDGIDLDPTDGPTVGPAAETAYPLRRRLWLRHTETTPPALIAALREALVYQPSPAVELVAVGDIMLGRLVKDYYVKNGPTYPYEGEGIVPLLNAADVAFANLECPISDRGVREDKGYEFRADPSCIEGLTHAGFDVLSLANNHTGDYGDTALTDTLDILSEADIVAVGAGRTITEAHAVQVIEVNGLRLGFLAYNQIGPNWFEAEDDSPGSAFMDRERMIEDVQQARELADVVIVSCHWGVEYTPYRNNSQVQYAQALAAAGASLIIGHHPHVVQGIDYIENTLVLYSLGNFVFDQGNPRATAEGIIARCVLDASGVKRYELLPVLTARCQPYLLPADEGASVLERIDRVTHERNGYRH